ncbi:MAG: hypothetical protein ACKVS6_03120 [Planctomycetota bacterium]
MATKTTKDIYKTQLGMGSEAVQKKTGKTWPEWIKALDREGCAKSSHKEIVAIIDKKFGLDPWWQQMVTVGYEQLKGLRAKHEKPDGFSAGVSKTINTPVDNIYNAWSDAKKRRAWLPENIEIRTATKNKSLRIKWPGGKSSIDVNLYSKGEAKTQVTVQHNKLLNANETNQMKMFWKAKLGGLAAQFES